MPPGQVATKFFREFNFYGGVGQLILLKASGNSLFENAIFIRAKTFMDFDMGCENMMFSIQRPKVKVMNIADTIYVEQ